MKILVDEEARKLVEQLCDVTLKAGGLGNINPVLIVLQRMENYVPPVPVELEVPVEPEVVSNE